MYENILKFKKKFQEFNGLDPNTKLHKVVAVKKLRSIDFSTNFG